eukprot:Blabericola_migrator_1__12458@NODE_786_length_6534_cov_13_057214_g556_i0_p6_GENE_NODE_786_length_6534_cov_13_057214_g556_i0NODE_786_length_6534_cov_13_057214_g556_i0_p6_ORF_typecomplete_len110_score13_75_NODE_786_length_6534_cov_13_057214_g556_i0100429
MPSRSLCRLLQVQQMLRSQNLCILRDVKVTRQRTSTADLSSDDDVDQTHHPSQPDPKDRAPHKSLSPWNQQQLNLQSLSCCSYLLGRWNYSGAVAILTKCDIPLDEQST